MPSKHASETERKAAGETPTGLPPFLTAERSDRKVARIAWACALVFHGILLALHLPRGSAEAAPLPDKEPLRVVKVYAFSEPPPPPVEPIKPPVTRVPVPSPDPDKPEPIRRDDEEIRPQFEVPETDEIFGDIPGPPPVRPTGPIRMSAEVKAPVPIDKPLPRYTEIARKARIEGIVIVEAVIDVKGRVTDMKVLKALPMGLDQAAMDAMRNWTFEPATLNGHPVAVYFSLSTHFTLN